MNSCAPEKMNRLVIRFPGGILPEEITALQNRDPQALDRWFLHHADAVYTFHYYLAGKNHSLAADLTHDTFAWALDHLDKYEPCRGTMRVWLLYIGRNMLRREQRRIARLQPLPAEHGPAGQLKNTQAVWPDPAPGPDVVLATAETISRIWLVLAALPDRFSRLLEQHYRAGIPLVELARQEGLSPGGIKSLLHRARQAFRQAWEDVDAPAERPGSTLDGNGEYPCN